MSQPKILFLITGGTILSEKRDAESGALPHLNIDTLLSRYPFLKDKAEIDVRVFSNIDSRLMTPDIWLDLAKTLQETLQDRHYQGVVILHGTDTLEETAFFLSLTCHGDKPIVLTGAMRAADEFDTDGPRNLQQAIEVVLSAKDEHAGVTVVMNGHIYSPTYVFKTNTSLPNSFDVGRVGPLGVIENDQVKWFHRVKPYAKFPIPKALPKVDILFATPGVDNQVIQFLMKNGAKGFIVVGYGCGNIHDDLAHELLFAHQQGLPIVMATRVREGSVFPVYGGKGGGFELQKAGFIYHHDLSPFKARILLMLAIAEFKYNPAKIAECFAK